MWPCQKAAAELNAEAPGMGSGELEAKLSERWGAAAANERNGGPDAEAWSNMSAAEKDRIMR